ncbi:MAG TPA: cytochrome C, partial [Armatimonadota bacterium]|nr:cytochrome C [Armatimonadota bacterium]
MKSFPRSLLALTLPLPVAGVTLAVAAPAPYVPHPAPNATGAGLTFTTRRRIDPQNPYFQSLGANGRTCNSCHVEKAGWSLAPEEIQARFDATHGLDPLFRTNDGSNSPVADVST